MKEDLAEENLDTLQKFGPVFQSKVLSCLLTNREFLEQTYDIIIPHYFENDANKWIIDKILWYFNEYRNVPTMEVFKQELDKLESNNKILKVSIIEQLHSVYINTKAEDLEYIQNEFLTFCKNQSMKNAVLKSADLLKKGKYDEIKSLIERSMRAGEEKDVGHIWSRDLELRISKVARATIPTPWPVINYSLDGGLGPGELGCIIAPSGQGKSWLLRAIGAEALRQGKTVVDYTFELSQNYVGLRYDTIITGIEPQQIKKHADKVRNEIDQISGNLIIKYFPTRYATVNHLSAHLNQLIQLGHKPDLLIIDYADLMRSVDKHSAKHEELGSIYEEIRGLLGELNIPGWTASQSQRSALQDDVVEADKIAGAYSKVFVSDVVMSASRKLADKINNTARIHLIKNRFGPDGMTFPAFMDLSRGKMEIYDENSSDGILIKNEMKNGAGKIQQMLQKKLMDIKNKNTSELDELDDEDSINLG